MHINMIQLGILLDLSFYYSVTECVVLNSANKSTLKGQCVGIVYYAKPCKRA